MGFLHVKSLNQFHFMDQVNFRMGFNTVHHRARARGLGGNDKFDIHRGVAYASEDNYITLCKI